MNNLKKEVNILLQKKKEKERSENFEKMILAFDKALEKGVKINDSVVISNFSELFEHLSFEFPETFKIENPEEIAKYIRIPEAKDFPKKFSISNPGEIAKYIKIPETKFPKEFRISNFPETKEIEFPDNLKKLSLKQSEHFLSNIYERIGAYAQALTGGIFISNKKQSESIPVKLVDSDGFVDIPKFSFSRDGRLQVEVDRAGGSSAGGLNQAESEALQSVATEAKQDPLASYKDAGMDIASNPMYLGFIDINGAWYIKKIDTESGSTFCKGDSDYPTAWEGKEELTYGLFNNIF